MLGSGTAELLGLGWLLRYLPFWSVAMLYRSEFWPGYKFPMSVLPTNRDDKTRAGLSLLPSGSVPPQVVLPQCVLSPVPATLGLLDSRTQSEQLLKRSSPGRVPVSSSISDSSPGPPRLLALLMCTDPQPVARVGLPGVVRGATASEPMVALTSCLGTLGGQELRSP